MSEILEYDKLLVQSLQHIEGVLERFALQHYATAGAVFLAYFTDKISLGITTLSVVAVGVAFTMAIWSNIVRYRLIWKLHRIARDNWLDTQPALREAFRIDADCEIFLSVKIFSWRISFLQTIVINLLPAIVAVALFVGAETGIVDVLRHSPD
jgi:hypothetical protein